VVEIHAVVMVVESRGGENRGGGNRGGYIPFYNYKKKVSM
jgi:hypothetical protein